MYIKHISAWHIMTSQHIAAVSPYLLRNSKDPIPTPTCSFRWSVPLRAKFTDGAQIPLRHSFSHSGSRRLRHPSPCPTLSSRSPEGWTPSGEQWPGGAWPRFSIL